MTIEIPSTHISISCAQEMREIVSPLSEQGISYFEHVRLYNEGKIAWLSTDDIRAKSILENEISGALDFDFSKLQSQRYVFAEDVVATINDSSMRKIATNKLIDSRDNFDIRNLFQIISIKNGIYEAFVFGTNEKSNLAKSNYIKLIPFLEHFIFYYYDKAEQLINKSEKTAIKIPDLKVIVKDQSTPNLMFPITNRYYFDLKNKNEYLTNREFEVFYLLSRGYARKEIAEQLGLKPRTIDSLILNAIERNNTFNLRCLIDKIKDSAIGFCLNFTSI